MQKRKRIIMGITENERQARGRQLAFAKQIKKNQVHSLALGKVPGF